MEYKTHFLRVHDTMGLENPPSRRGARPAFLWIHVCAGYCEMDTNIGSIHWIYFDLRLGATGQAIKDLWLLRATTNRSRQGICPLAVLSRQLHLVRSGLGTQ